MTVRRAMPLTVLVATSMALTACAATSAGDGPDEQHAGLRIAAASSLTGTLDELAREFELQHPGISIAPIDYEGSPTLVTQILGGRRVDVFASADETSMAAIASEIDGRPVAFATNALVIAVPAGNPEGIRTLADLADDDLRIVLCAPQVPCGASARELLSAAGVSIVAASEEQNVKAVVAKVQAAEADAGLVYATDAIAAEGAFEGIPIDGAEDARTVYPIAALDDSENPAAARAFVAWMRSPQAREILARAGFGAP